MAFRIKLRIHYATLKNQDCQCKNFVLTYMYIIWCVFVEQTIDLWSCRHITGDGLVALVKKCTKLEFLDVWGMRIPVEYFFRLLSDNPQIDIKPGVFYWNVERLALWPVF